MHVVSLYNEWTPLRRIYSCSVVIYSNVSEPNKSSFVWALKKKKPQRNL